MDVQAGHLGGGTGLMTGGDVERKGFVLGIGEVALHGGKGWRVWGAGLRNDE